MKPIMLRLAGSLGLRWCKEMVERHHYLHTVPDPRTRPIAFVVELGDEDIGCLWFGRPESTRCFQGNLRFGSRDDVAAGRASYDRWEILNLSRVWLSPDVQPGGRLYTPDLLPGYFDRSGRWRSTVASTVIKTAMRHINFRYLYDHPPCFPEQPYEIRVCLSYCDTRWHKGTIYQAAGFRWARRNARGIETWFTTDVLRLGSEQVDTIKRRSANCPRAERIRQKTNTNK